MKTLRVEFKHNMSPGSILRGVLLVVGLLATSVLTHQPIASIFFWLMLLLYGACTYLLTIGPIEMNDQFIRLTTRFGQFEMKWEEVESVTDSDLNNGQRQIIIYGAKKTKKVLAIPSFQHWKGEDRAAMIEFFNSRTTALGIPVERNDHFGFRLCKNTRVSRKRQTAAERL